MEGLYSILANWDEPDGGVKESGDKDRGERYNQDKNTVIRRILTSNSDELNKVWKYLRTLP